MIKASDAIRVARQLIGTPYSVLDCINLIKKVIRTAPGGVPGYTTAGTNALWKSYGLTKKYKDLVSRKTGIADARAGMIAFKADGSDFHHAGIVTDVGTVIHSSSTQGGRGVVETPLTAREGWTHLAVHRYIEAVDTAEEEAMYKAQVALNSSKSSLNVRVGPSTADKVVGTLPDEAVVSVLAANGDWSFIQYQALTGYVASRYLVKAGDEVDVPVVSPVEPESAPVTIIDSEGNRFAPVGDFRVLFGGVD